MRKLKNYLVGMKSKILTQCDFIETASVPVIKLECDLQMVQEDMRSQVA